MGIKYNYLIVGGGILGLATAYKLALKCPQKTILVLEKETQLAAHQTGNNSGVIHSGIYYTPGSLKAKNCINGREQLLDFAKKHLISHEMCGKLIAAFEESEIETLKKIYKNGIENGLEDIKILTSEESKNHEPYADHHTLQSMPLMQVLLIIDKLWEFSQKSFRKLTHKIRC